jgi:hypothetical protein
MGYPTKVTRRTRITTSSARSIFGSPSHQTPDQIIASNQTNGSVNFTRPLCPYPQNARYKGTGSTSDAANFVCSQDDDDLPTNFDEALRLSGALIGKP